MPTPPSSQPADSQRRHAPSSSRGGCMTGTGEKSNSAVNELLCFSLYTATHRIIRAYRPLLEPLGLTYVQYLVMLVLWEAAPRSVGELGHCLHLDSGTLTPLLKRMEKSGLVRRERDSDDERRVLVSLTEAGRSLEREAAPIRNAMLCEFGLSEDEAAKLQGRIQKLADSLER